MISTVKMDKVALAKYHQDAIVWHNKYSSYLDPKKKILSQLKKAATTPDQHHQILAACFEGRIANFLKLHHDKQKIHLYSTIEKLDYLNQKNTQGKKPDFLFKVLESNQQFYVEAKIRAKDDYFSQPLQIFKDGIKNNFPEKMLLVKKPMDHTIFSEYWLEKQLPQETDSTIFKKLHLWCRAAYDLNMSAFDKSNLTEIELQVLSSLMNHLPNNPPAGHPNISLGIEIFKQLIKDKLLTQELKENESKLEKKERISKELLLNHLRTEKKGYIIAVSAAIFFDGGFSYCVHSYQERFYGIFINNPYLSGVILSFVPEIFSLDGQLPENKNDFCYVPNPFATHKLPIENFSFLRVDEINPFS